MASRGFRIQAMFYTFLGFRYLQGQGALVGRLMMGILGASIWLPGIINLLTKSPRPPSRALGPRG